MNNIQERRVHELKSGIAAIRRGVDELASFGVKMVDPGKPFDKFVADLDTNQQELKALRPGTKTYEERLGELLEKESFLLQALEGSLKAAEEMLAAAQITFFQERDTHIKPLQERQAQTHKAIQKGAEQLTGALQELWQAMSREYEFQGMIQRISEQYNLSPQIGQPVMRMPKPFRKVDVNSFDRLVEVTLSRLAEVLSSGEAMQPRDIAETLYRRE